MKRLHLMILSVGSLLGQNILDALEGRRHNLIVTGLNSVADNPRLFRCDKAFLVPPAENTEFEARLVEIIKEENPDAILPGRDNDILVLARLRQRYPLWADKIPLGSVSAAEIMDDKLKSYQFAQIHELPFAPTVALFEGEKIIGDFIDEHDFPLIAKPALGFGSQGIKILTKPMHVQQLLRHGDPNTVLQPLLGVSSDYRLAIESFDAITASGVPFFFHLPDELQYASQTFIGPDGLVETPFCSISTMILGRCEKSRIVADPEFEAISTRYAHAIAKEGWIGMFNLQCRKTPSGYFGIEMNGRMSGSTSARALLGYDEIRMLLDKFYHVDIGDIPNSGGKDGVVYRVLTNTYVSNRDVDSLQKNGWWSSKNNGDRIVLTGATGYIGQALIKKLKEQNSSLTILTNSPSVANRFGSDVEVLPAEDFDKIPWREVSTLVHLGFARPHHGQGALNSSLEYSARLINHAAKQGVQSIIFISSRSVYGTSELLPVDESTPANPASPYGVAKRAVELLIESLKFRSPLIKTTIVRLGAVNGAGYGSTDVAAVSKFVKTVLAGEPIIINGGNQTTDLLHLQDAAECLQKLIQCPLDERAEMYVISSPVAYTILELATTCVELSNNHQATLIIKPDQNLPSFAMNPSRFGAQFHWAPRYCLSDIVKSLIEQESDLVN